MHEFFEPRLMQVRRPRQLYVPVHLATPGEETVGVRERRASDQPELDARLAQNERADRALVARAVRVGDEP